MRSELDYGLILRVARDQNGFFSVQPEPYGGPEAGSIGREAFFPYGVYGIPLDADATEEPMDAAVAAYSQPARLGASGVMLSIGEDTFVMPASDPRVLPILPDPGRGGVVYAGAYREGETIKVTTLLLAGNEAAGGVREGSVVLRVSDGANDYTFEIDRLTREIRVRHPDDASGAAILIKPGGFVELGGTPNAAVVIDVAGTFTAWVNAVSGITGAPAPPLYTSRVKARTLV
jgi:hypothetical protein